MVLMFALLSLAAKGQDSSLVKTPSKQNLGFDGMVAVSFGKNFYSVNVGGPSFFLVLGKKWKIGVCALPSLSWLEGNLMPRLGVAPRIDYMNWALLAPFYYRDKTTPWIWSLGLGYKFQKKKNT